MTLDGSTSTDKRHLIAYYFHVISIIFFNKTSCLEIIKLITEDCFPKHTNITTKFKWKLFTKVDSQGKKLGFH